MTSSCTDVTVGFQLDGFEMLLETTEFSYCLDPTFDNNEDLEVSDKHSLQIKVGVPFHKFPLHIHNIIQDWLKKSVFRLRVTIKQNINSKLAGTTMGKISFVGVVALKRVGWSGRFEQYTLLVSLQPYLSSTSPVVQHSPEDEQSILLVVKLAAHLPKLTVYCSILRTAILFRDTHAPRSV